MATPVEQIKDRISIVDVVSAYVKLEKAGKNYKGLSPFNKEKTPSFFVSPDRGVYYCFSSHKGGDIFTFVEEMEGLDFQGALRVLAERAGVELVRESREKRDKRGRLYLVLQDAARYLEDELRKHKDTLAYLSKRGISEHSIEDWRIGYVPSGWDNIKSVLLDKGYALEEIERAGLIKRGEEGERKYKYYDRFRDRIMFPIFDSSSRIVGFSGRVFRDADGVAKYINSPETELFDKSSVLYGYNRAKNSIRKNNFSILVEGQVDVILSHQAGFKNAVAISGTALSDTHLKKLKQLSNNAVFAFDADAAGISSSGRAAGMALSMGMNIKVAPLPKGVDPADIISRNPEQWREVIRGAQHIIEYYLALLSESEKDKRKLYLKVHELVLPFLAKIQNKLDQAYFVTYIASELNVPEESIREELRKIPVSYELRQEEKRPVREIAPLSSRRETIEKSLHAILLWQESAKDAVIDAGEFKKKLITLLGKDEYGTLCAKHEEKRDQLAFEAEIVFGEKVKDSLEELIWALEEESVKESYLVAMESLKYAEEHGKKEDIDAMLKKCKELSDQLLTLKSRRHA